MTSFTIHISCGFCPEQHEQEINLPEGWQTRYGSVDEGEGFCPQHSAIAEFSDAQCPGCVEGWGDCRLWRSFAYEHEYSLTDSDFAQIRAGYCPKRTNGTFDIGPGGVRGFNISEQAPPESGLALEKAIRDYRIIYCD